jgi:hypothetical protein
MTQVIEYLPRKHETDPEFKPQHCQKEKWRKAVKIFIEFHLFLPMA